MKNLLALTLLTMVAFAGNSIIARMALAGHSIGPLSFSAIRLLAGAIVLSVLAGLNPVRLQQTLAAGGRGGTWFGDWFSDWSGAGFLLTYVVFFSYAYLWLDAGTGALILFATVQIVMIGSGFVQGERLSTVQWIGTGLALVGLIFLLRPGGRSGIAPPPLGAVMMGMSGLGWAMYSLQGRHVESPTLATAANFIKAALLVLLIGCPLLWVLPERPPQIRGVVLAVVSGGVTSGLGYALWYRVLRHLKATGAGIAQLSVPAIAAIGGLIFLNEALTIRLVITTATVLCGVALATLWKSPAES